MKLSATASGHAGEGAPSPTAVREQLRRVLASEGFRQSRRMAELLRFVVSETLAGSADRLKEYLIASEVFGRDESFDPRINAVVRVEVSRLRHRLREYFLGPGRDAEARGRENQAATARECHRTREQTESAHALSSPG